jgi:hypothetical protein
MAFPEGRLMRRAEDLQLVPVSSFSPDDHATCPLPDCGDLMAFDADRGALVCQGCRVAASDAAVDRERVAR